MTNIFVLLLGTILSVSTPDSGASNNATDVVFKPAQGWMLVSSGSLSDVRHAIEDYDKITKELKPQSFRVELHPQKGGEIVVLLPTGFPAYDLANMTGWLSAPPNQEQVNGAVAWLTSPGTGIKYYLKPEKENSWGDTESPSIL